MDVDKFEISPTVDDSRFVVQKKGLYGVYDKSGKALVPIEYQSIVVMPCGWILARTKNYETQHLFNAKGENIGFPYEHFVAHADGLAIVWKGGLCGIINQLGEEIVPLKYKDITKKIMHHSPYTLRATDGSVSNHPSDPDFITQNQKRVDDAKARSTVKGHFLIKKSNNEIGLLNLKRDTVVPPIYRFGPIHQDLGLIVASFDGKTWGVIDTRHQTLYPFTAEKMGNWTVSGLMPLRSEKKWALIRFPSGEVVFPFGEFEYIETYDPHKDLIIVAKNNLRGIINLKREVILPLEYTYISSYAHTTTELVDADQKHGFWFRPNGFVQKPVFAGIKHLNDSLVIVWRDSVQAVLDAKTGREVVPFSKYQIDKVRNYFDSHIKWNHKIQHTYGGHLHGLYDRNGRLVFAHDSVDITVFPDNSFFVNPQHLDSETLGKQFSADGKLLRSFPKLHGAPKGNSIWIVRHTNASNKSEYTVFSALDPPGQERIFQSVGDFKENLSLVKQNGKFGFADNEGKTVIPIVLDAAEPSADGYIRVKYQGKWGVLQNPKFDYFEQFEKSVKQ